MATYKINGHELTGSDEAIAQLKQLLADQANIRFDIEEKLEKRLDVVSMLTRVREEFGACGELVMRKGGNYIEFTVRYMRLDNSIAWLYTFRVSERQNSDDAYTYLKTAISEIIKQSNQNKEINS